MTCQRLPQLASDGFTLRSSPCSLSHKGLPSGLGKTPLASRPSVLTFVIDVGIPVKGRVAGPALLAVPGVIAVYHVVLVSLKGGGQRTHFCRRFPMKSCSPTRAKTLRQKTVSIITSDSFFTDWIRAPTMVFSPDHREGESWGWAGQGVTHPLSPCEPLPTPPPSSPDLLGALLARSLPKLAPSFSGYNLQLEPCMATESQPLDKGLRRLHSVLPQLGERHPVTQWS